MDQRSRRRLKRITLLAAFPILTALSAVGAYLLIHVGPLLATRRLYELFGIGLIYISIVLLTDAALAE